MLVYSVPHPNEPSGFIIIGNAEGLEGTAATRLARAAIAVRRAGAAVRRIMVLLLCGAGKGDDALIQVFCARSAESGGRWRECGPAAAV
jgi:hypothetical protein